MLDSFSRLYLHRYILIIIYHTGGGVKVFCNITKYLYERIFVIGLNVNSAGGILATVVNMRKPTKQK